MRIDPAPRRRAGVRVRAARRASVVAVLTALLVISSFCLQSASAKFTSSTTNAANHFAANSVYSGTRTVIANGVTDASSGTPTGASFVAAATDGLTANTKTYPSYSNGYSTSKYLEVQYTSPLPDQVPVSGVTVKVVFHSANTSTSSCVYAELFALSTMTSYGSTTELCYTANAAGFSTLTYAFPAVSTATKANDLMVRLYGKNSAAPGGSITLDEVSVSGNLVTSVSTPFTLHMAKNNDQSNGTASWGTWSLNAPNDGVTGQTSTAAPTTFTATKFVDYYFPFANQKFLPSNAIVTAVTLQHRWAPSANSQLCYYAEVYNTSSTKLGTLGSAVSPQVCRTGTTAYAQDSIDLLSIASTAADLNGLAYGSSGAPARVAWGATRTTSRWT